MNERERFRETVRFGKPDKIPLWPGEPRESTLETWHQQGLPEGADWYTHHHLERFPGDLEERCQGVDNLLIVGRMMAVDLVTHNSTRNTVCCLVCGQTDEAAAAMAAQDGVMPGAVDVGELCRRLKAARVILQSYL